MGARPPAPEQGVDTEELEPKPNGHNGSMGGILLRFAAMGGLLAMVWLDWTNADWEPPQLIVVGFIAALLGITGREAIDLIRDRVGGGK